jgi:hypothetical protein
MSEEEKAEAEVEEVSRGDAEGAEVKPEEGAEGEEKGATARVPQERLDREVGRRKESEETLGQVEREREELRAKVAEFEDAAQSAVPLDPSYLTRDERVLVMRANELEAEEVRLEEAPEGIEDDPKLNTAQKVRARLVQVRQELRHTSLKANEVYERAKVQQRADLKAGREARLARERAKKQGTGDRGQETERPAMSLAGAGAGAPGGVPGRKMRGPSEEEFTKAGGTKEAAARELSKLVPD